MKKNLVIACCFIIFLGCNLDDGTEGVAPPNFDVLGLWDLTEVNVNPPQDLNEDGTASANLLNELDCLSGELLIDGNLQWELNQTELIVTTITNGLFEIQCNGMITETGAWFSDENEVTFTGNSLFSSLEIEDETLVFIAGEDLPGIQSFIYVLRQ